MKSAATDTRTLRTFLLMAQLEAKAIGARIKQARRESGMTQEQVADIASFSKRSLQDYENGVTIPWRHLREISRLLDCPVEWLIHGPAEGEADAAGSSAPALDDIGEKLDRLTVIVERLAEDLAASRSGQDAGRSSRTG